MNALSGVIPYINITNRRSLLNTFFISQFNYCPLTWMCHSRAQNNKINRLHERCLSIIYKGKVYTFEQPSEKDSSVFIHKRNRRFLAVTLSEVVNGLAPTIINDFFSLKETNSFLRYLKMGLLNGFESISYLEPKICEMLPSEMQECETL